MPPVSPLPPTLLFFLLACAPAASPPLAPAPAPPSSPTLSVVLSDAASFDCGSPRSPALSWSGAPPETAAYALALAARQPDGRLEIAWVWWDLPAPADGLAGGQLPTRAPPTQGAGSAGTVGYQPPCAVSPVPATLRLHALDAALGLPPTAPWPELEDALRQHTLAWGVLTLPGASPDVP